MLLKRPVNMFLCECFFGFFTFYDKNIRLLYFYLYTSLNATSVSPQRNLTQLFPKTNTINNNNTLYNVIVIKINSPYLILFKLSYR